MIPKIIHYCWFGKGEMSQEAKRCIGSWTRLLPDYELRLWNENNFDISSNPYTEEAYECRKFAFVTDYVRLYALKEFGGVYMDTDVEVIKSIDGFLSLPAFSGFEDDTNIPTGLMASEKNGRWVSELLEYYRDRHFILPDGKVDTKTNVVIITEHMLTKGFRPNGEYQLVDETVAFYPKDFFCAKSQKTGKVTITANTHTIHHFAGSWLTPFQKFKVKCKPVLASLGLYGIVKRLYKRK